MANIEAKSEGAVSGQVGEGPNFVAAEISHDSRLRVSAGLGVSGEKQTATGKFLGALGGRISGALKLNKHNDVSGAGSSPQDRIGLRDAAVLFGKIQDMTDGTGDLNKLTVNQVDELRTRFPVIFSASQHKNFDRISQDGRNVTLKPEDLDIVRKQLIYIGEQSPEVKTSPVYNLAVAELQSNKLASVNIGQQTLGDIQSALGVVDAAWPLATSVLVTQQSTVLTPEQAQLLSSQLDKAGHNIRDARALVGSLPRASEIQDVNRKVKQIVGYDSKLDLSLSATGAYASNNGVVVAGDVTHGIRAAVDNVVFRRDTPDSKLRLDIEPTRYTSVGLSAGVGHDTFSALPPDMAKKLGVVPEAKTAMGAYVAAKKERSKTFGVSGDEQSLMAGFNAGTILSDGNYAYANVEVSQNKTPDTTPSSKKISLITGIKF